MTENSISIGVVVLLIVMALGIARKVSDLRERNAVLVERLRATTEERDTLHENEDYWRVRAERLMDAALARRGEIHEPTMREAPKERPTDAGSLITAAMAITEFSSGSQAAPHRG